MQRTIRGFSILEILLSLSALTLFYCGYKAQDIATRGTTQQFWEKEQVQRLNEAIALLKIQYPEECNCLQGDHSEAHHRRILKKLMDLNLFDNLPQKISFLASIGDENSFEFYLIREGCVAKQAPTISVVTQTTQQDLSEKTIQSGGTITLKNESLCTLQDEIIKH